MRSPPLEHSDLEIQNKLYCDDSASFSFLDPIPPQDPRSFARGLDDGFCGELDAETIHLSHDSLASEADWRSLLGVGFLFHVPFGDGFLNQVFVGFVSWFS